MTGRPAHRQLQKVAGGVVGFVILVAAVRKLPPLTPAAVPEKLPIWMLHHRLLVAVDQERRAPLQRRHRDPRDRGDGCPAPGLVPGRRRRAAPRSVQVDDRVLFDPEDKAEVEVQGDTYVVMRERDIHAVASDRLGDETAGLYL